MSFLLWNVRRLGNSYALDKLCNLLRSTFPNLVFLIKTKLNSSKARDLASKVGFINHMVVDSQRRSGGFILLWRDIWNVQLFSFLKGYS